MNVTPITTTKAEATVLILAAYAAKTLPAQNGMTGTYYAVNGKGKVCQCAIGVLYPVADAKELEGQGADADHKTYLMVHTLIAKGLLIVPDNEREWFIDIQSAHDDWAGFEGDDREAYFLSLLQ